MLELTPHQNDVFQGILELIQAKKPFVATLNGCAGTGKTTLTTKLATSALQLQLKVVGLAPTHKAKKVLHRFLNMESFYSIKTFTIASALNKMRVHSYVGTKRFKSRGGNKMANFNLFIIDECSMIADEDAEKIIEFARNFDKMLLFVGDSCQIPNPTQMLEENEDETFSKADSCTFSVKNKFTLTEIIRQSDDNPLINIYDQIRKDLCTPFHFDRVSKCEGGVGVVFVEDEKEFNKKLMDVVKSKQEYRIIAYTNATVELYNTLVRKALGYTHQFHINEILMGYENTGWPTPIVENGQDYEVMSITQTNTKSVDKFFNLVGHIVTLRELDTDLRTRIFFPTPTHPKNMELLGELVDRAECVNRRGSNVDDFKHYRRLKDEIFFMETIYKFEGEIFTKNSFKSEHLLLMRHTNEVIDPESRVVKSNKVVDKINEMYPFLIKQRLRDGKTITDVEKLCDMFQVVEKDLDYGYSITAHKSQGSTYDNVFIVERDFSIIEDGWNYSMDVYERRTKEKNQLLYVAYTRPKYKAVVLF